MNLSQYDGNFPIMDALVAVHYDILLPNDFVRIQTESRIGEYLDKGKDVYNLSALRNPNNGPNIIDIASPTEIQENFGLELQLMQLLGVLENKELNIEIDGWNFFNCVYRTFKELDNESSINPKINFDCTNSVLIYWIYASLGKDYTSARYKTFDGEEMHIPKPSPDTLERHMQHLKKFPRS